MTQELLLKAYYFLELNRALEERLLAFYMQNKVVGGLYRSLGQEAISVGSALALQPQDWIAPLIRNVGAYLVRGYQPRDLFTQYMAKATSPTRGRDCNTHFGDCSRGVVAPISMLGAMIPVMVGVGWASRLQEARGVLGGDGQSPLDHRPRGVLGGDGESPLDHGPRVAMTYIGDGGTSTGDFHEGLNLASVWKAPFVLIGENNGFAYSTPTSSQMAIADLVERVRAYAIPAEIVDGNDVVAVYEATCRALEHARSGQGPYFLECKTMRMRGHAEHDDARYVPAELLEAWRSRDPIHTFRRRLLEEFSIPASVLEDLRQKVAQVIEVDAEFADQSPFPTGEDVLEGVFA